jgi:hypothetical protein
MTTAWSYADLEPAQVDLVHEAEQTLDTDVVMAYAPSAWGAVDPETVATGLEPVDLDSSQLDYLQRLERMVGGVLVAYRRAGDRGASGDVA